MYWHFVLHELKISLRGYCLKTSRVAGAPRRSRELLGGGHRFFELVRVLSDGHLCVRFHATFLRNFSFRKIV